MCFYKDFVTFRPFLRVFCFVRGNLTCLNSPRKQLEEELKCEDLREAPEFQQKKSIAQKAREILLGIVKEERKRLKPIRGWNSRPRAVIDTTRPRTECLDFKNGACTWKNCKFAHVQRPSADGHRRKADLVKQVQKNAIQKRIQKQEQEEKEGNSEEKEEEETMEDEDEPMLVDQNLQANKEQEHPDRNDKKRQERTQSAERNVSTARNVRKRQKGGAQNRGEDHPQRQ